jgi:glucokinase
VNAQGCEDLTTIATLGIDVGGTKVALGIATGTGRLIARRYLETAAAEDATAFLAATVAEASELVRANKHRVSVVGIGVGVPELVDRNGQIRTSCVVAWRLREVLDAFGEIAPVVVEADVRAAALAEAEFGAGKDYGTFVYVTVGTGISYCLIQSKKPYGGSRGYAQLLGSAPLSLRCPHCNDRIRFTLEDVASGPALAAKYNERTNALVKRAEDVFVSARHGENAALKTLREAGVTLGSAVAFVVNLLDPEAVVVGGGLGSAKGPYWENFERSVRDHLWPLYDRPLPILHAGLGKDAGVLGAAYVALQHLARPGKRA